MNTKFSPTSGGVGPAERIFTLLNVLHFQVQAGYEDADCLWTLPVQQLYNLKKRGHNSCCSGLMIQGKSKKKKKRVTSGDSSVTCYGEEMKPRTKDKLWSCSKNWCLKCLRFTFSAFTPVIKFTNNPLKWCKYLEKVEQLCNPPLKMNTLAPQIDPATRV